MLMEKGTVVVSAHRDRQRLLCARCKFCTDKAKTDTQHKFELPAGHLIDYN